MIILRIAMALACCAAPAVADPPVIEKIAAQQNGESWRFDVTLSHPDTGDEHYADGWRVVDMDGNELGMRVLYHPHVHEQPFTRSLSGVTLPAGTTKVGLQARCNVDGWSDDIIPLTLSDPIYTR